jgi:hypothetical protein
MKRFLLVAALVLSAASVSAAQSLNDQVVLGNDAIFIQRVRQALVTAAINISSDALSTGINLKRHAQVQAIMNNPDGWKQLFAEAIATQAAVFNPATVNGTVVLKPMVCTGIPTGCTETGNVDTQQALVTDAVINTNVAAVFNAFFGGQ